MPPEILCERALACEAAFAAALLDPDRATPDSLLGPLGRPDARRLAVYRNNVTRSLIDALMAQYPVTLRLVGEDFFAAAARSFIARHKPQSPVLLLYGDGFAAFIAAFPGAEDLPYLADVARLEDAWRAAYHAAEAEPLPLSALAAVAPHDLAALRLALHPAARFLASPLPVGSIWHAHQAEPPDLANLPAGPERLLVVRPQAEVTVLKLQPSVYCFAERLAEGDRLGAAAEAAGSADPTFDFGTALVGLVNAGTFRALSQGDN